MAKVYEPCPADLMQCTSATGEPDGADSLTSEPLDATCMSMKKQHAAEATICMKAKNVGKMWSENRSSHHGHQRTNFARNPFTNESPPYAECS